MKGNKGEWSEIYTLLKLLSDTKVFVGDKFLNRIPDLLYPIIKILRDETNGHFEYSVKDSLVFISDGESILKIPIYLFKENAGLLLNRIKEAHSSSFEVPEIEEFLSEIKCSSLKAKSNSKTDIRIVIHDARTNLQPELGFSIKSQLGGASTLLNAGRTTNFIYRVICDRMSISLIDEINEINTRSKIKDRIEALNDNNAKIQFVRTENKVFGNNLTLIDSLLPNILADIVFSFYSSSLSYIADLIENAEVRNPMNFDTSYNHRFYEYKIKKLLTEVALGMMPSTLWNGVYDATGGYLIVKEDGEVLSYHLYNKNMFEDYLFHNTKLDTASSSRHRFGEVYREDGDFFIKLNLQIRFRK